LGRFADALGLGAALSARIVPSGERFPLHDRGKVLVPVPVSSPDRVPHHYNSRRSRLKSRALKPANNTSHLVPVFHGAHLHRGITQDRDLPSRGRVGLGGLTEPAVGGRNRPERRAAAARRETEGRDSEHQTRERQPATAFHRGDASGHRQRRAVDLRGGVSAVPCCLRVCHPCIPPRGSLWTPSTSSRA
jgi:hypothetical protein